MPFSLSSDSKLHTHVDRDRERDGVTWGETIFCITGPQLSAPTFSRFGPHPSTLRGLRGPTLRQHVGLKQHWPKQVNTFTGPNSRPKQVRPKQVNLA